MVTFSRTVTILFLLYMTLALKMSDQTGICLSRYITGHEFGSNKFLPEGNLSHKYPKEGFCILHEVIKVDEFDEVDICCRRKIRQIREG